MKYLRLLAILGIFLIPTHYAQAQHVSVGVGIGVPGVPVQAYVGPAPVCAYGYYPYYPYACAPYGYYGPQWFSGGVFIGAGPWFHGFYGHPGYWGRPGWEHGYYGQGFYGHPGSDRGFHGTPAPGFHGGFRAPAPAFRGGGGFHGGGAFHGGGHR